MTENKNKVHRPVSASEIFVGTIILIVLAIIAILVFMEQHKYDPGLFRLDQSLINTPPAAEETGRPIPDILRRVGLRGGLSAGKVESFTAENVYEKIDGRDQAFLDLDMRTLDVIALSVPDHPGDSFEVFVYNMAQPENAFGIFAANQTDDPAWSYNNVVGQAAPNGLFFYQGPYYVCLVGSSTTETLHEAIVRTGETLVSMLPGQSAQLWAQQVFPTEQLKPHSVRYIFKGWLGTDFFDKVFTAQYNVNTKDYTAYVARRADAAEADKIFGQVTKFLTDNGGKIIPNAVPSNNNNNGHSNNDNPNNIDSNNKVIVAELMGAFEVVFCENNYIGGVSQAPNQADAIAVANKLKQTITQYMQQNP